MSDYASIDASLDSAFSAMDNAHGEISDAIEDNILPPNALSSEGIWALAKETKQKEKDAKALKAKQEGQDNDKDERRLGKNEIKGRKKADQEAGIDAALNKATKRSAEKQAKADSKDAPFLVDGKRPKPLEPKAFNDKDFMQARKELRERSGGLKLSERMSEFERWEAAFKSDPVKAREAIMRAYMNFQPNKPGKDDDTPKSGKSNGQKLNDTLDKAFSSSDEMTDLKDYTEKYGEFLPQLMKRLNDVERDLIDDPVGASARLAAQYGALDEPQPVSQPTQSTQIPPPATLEESVRRGLDKAIEQNIFPGLQDDKIAETVAQVLTLMPRTQDRFADLKTAYGMVVGMSQAVTAKQDDAGQKSIHGAPSPPSGGGRRKGGGNSIDDAISRAFGRI